MTWYEDDLRAASAAPTTTWLSRVPHWVLDLIVSMTILAAALFSFPAERRAETPWEVFLAVLPVPFLLGRRRWPIPVLGACLVVFATAAFGATLTPGILLAMGIAMFNVATRLPRRATLVTAVSVTGIAVLVTVFATIGSFFDPLTVQVAVFVAFSAAAGDATRSRREYIRAITDRALRAESARESEARRRVAEERLRIARDLHDTVAHQISVISLNAAVVAAAMESRPERAQAALSGIRTASRTVLTEIGDLLTMLRTTTDAAGGEPQALQPGLRQLDDFVARIRDLGLDVTIRKTGDMSRLSPAADVVAYRVVQEALTNAHKHGVGNRADLDIAADTRELTIVVTNLVDETARPARTRDREVGLGGFGLLGLSERVTSVRGAIMHDRTDGEFRVRVSIPLVEEER